MVIILPRSYVAPVPTSEAHRNPFFFLAGPVNGGGDWQAEMCRKLESKRRASEYWMAIPSIWGKEHPLYKNVIPGDSHAFERQLDWERYYLNFAARNGCIIFWVPNESTNDPRDDGESYGRDTCGEIARWGGYLKYDPSLRVVIGVAPEMQRKWDVLLRNFIKDTSGNPTIWDTVDKTVKSAIKIARRS